MRRTFTYRPQPGRAAGTRRLLAVTAIVVFLFFIDSVSGGAIRHTLRDYTSAVSQWASRTVSAVVGSGAFTSKAALVAQNRSLTEQLAQSQERAAGFDALQAENEQLRSLVQLVQDTSGEGGVTAPVISSIRSSPYGTFLIGAGSEEGIIRGSVVKTRGGFVVGTVSDAGSHTSLVAELFAPGATIEAIIGSAIVSATGSGGGNARAEVPRGLSIAPGDTVISPQFGQRPIGVVGSVASSTGSAMQHVYIRLPVNLASLQYVYIAPIRN